MKWFKRLKTAWNWYWSKEPMITIRDVVCIVKKEQEQITYLKAELDRIYTPIINRLQKQIDNELERSMYEGKPKC